MSILIKGMEMPENCFECALQTDYGTCGFYSLYVEAGHEVEINKRREDCPLIEVPEVVLDDKCVLPSIIVSGKQGFKCSSCSFGDFDGFHGYKPKYCPNCGAKVEAE